MKTDYFRISRRTSVSCVIFGILLLTGASLAANKSELDGDVYQISIQTLTEKKEKALVITVLPKDDAHCNLEYPWKVKVTETNKISFEKDQFGRADASIFTAQKVVFRIPVTSKKTKGSAMLELKLSMCNDTQCFMKKVPIRYTLP